MSVLEGMHEESVACALSPFFHVSGLVNEREMEGWYQLHNFKSNNSDWERKFLSGSVQIICGIVMVIWKEPGLLQVKLAKTSTFTFFNSY